MFPSINRNAITESLCAVNNNEASIFMMKVTYIQYHNKTLKVLCFLRLH